MKVLPLNKIDVTRYPIIHPIYTWLFSHGYVPSQEGDRLFLVRQIKKLPRVAREVFIAAGVATFLLMVIVWFFNVVPKLKAQVAAQMPAIVEQSESCGCANRPLGCKTAVFTVDTDSGSTAYCSIWDDGQSCCVVH